MKIKVLIPNSGMDPDTLKARERMLSRAVSVETEVSVECIPEGPESIESHIDEVYAAPMVVNAAIKAEKDNFDAFVIYCFSDLAIDAVREKVSIPVIGPGETAIALANIISDKFAVITTVQKNIHRTYSRLMKNVIAREKMETVRAIDVPVIALRTNPNATAEYLMKACRKAVEDNGVDTIILGCLGMAEYGDEIARELGIKIIDPAFLAVAVAELSARLNILQAKQL